MTDKEQAVIDAARVWRTTRGMAINEPNTEIIEFLVNAEASLASAVADLEESSGADFRYIGNASMLRLDPQGDLFVEQINSEPT